MPVLLLSFLLAADFYLFTSFRGNGETGLFLALSQDGHTWEELNEGRSWLPPEHNGQLMRDPFIAKGPDNHYHLIWTWGWRRDQMDGKLQIGYASSPDLVHWSPQRAIPVFPGEPTARNAWAPEMAWDPGRKEWLIFWATTIPGRFPDTEKTGDEGYNHRHYVMTTRDFKTFSEPRLFYDPGFNSIDASLFQANGRWTMVFKDERRNPVMKVLKLAFANSPAGPWSEPSEPISRDWVEGPSPMQIGEWWYIYYDRYTKPQHYGAIRSKDLKTWEDITPQLKFPSGHRHGTILRIDAETANRLRAVRR
jgi:hypothetical protein